MAIKKPLLLPTGVVVEYHRISKAEIFPKPANFVQLTVDLFLSEEARAAGYPFVYQERLQVPFSEVEGITGNLMQSMYQILVSAPNTPFNGAESIQNDEEGTGETEVDPSTVAPGAVVAEPVDE